MRVVVLPGLDGTGTLLADFCSALEARGVPASVVGYPPGRPLDYDGLEAIVRGQLPKTHFVLLGESFSGPLAIRIAADPPPGLVGLVLSTTFARSPIGNVSAIAPLLRFAPARPPMALLSWWLLGPWATPRLRAQLCDALGRVDPAVLRTRAAETLRVDAAGRLGAITVPVLQLVAGNYRLLASAAYSRLAAGLPHCQTVELPAPHWLLQVVTGPAARVVAGFASGLVAERREASH